MKKTHKPDIYDIIVKNIRRCAAKDGDSNSILQISKRVGIPQSTLHDKMKNPRKFTLEDLLWISKGLNTSLEELINQNF